MGVTVLGIEPGLKSTGYAILQYNGPAPSILEAGRIATREKDAIEIRLRAIFDGLAEIIAEFKPSVMAVEKLYSHYKHPQTAVIMGHARGIILLCAANLNVPVISYAATKIKKSLTGNGRASKLQMQRTVKNVMKLNSLPEPSDVADAIAAALCHIESSK